MTADPRDTPMGVADPGLNPQLQAALLMWQSSMAAAAGQAGTP